VAGLREAGLHIPCLTHILQLVFKDGCLAQPAVVELTAKAHKLVGHYKHSNLATYQSFAPPTPMGAMRGNIKGFDQMVSVCCPTRGQIVILIPSLFH